MLAQNALQEFQVFMKTKGAELKALKPIDAVKLIIEFYKEIRAENCVIEDDGDMLLFQWGTYDWGKGEVFDYNITRQFIFPVKHTSEYGTSVESEIWQLSLTLKYEPTHQLRDLGPGGLWCDSPADIAEFEDYVLGCEATSTAQGLQAIDVHLEYYQT